MKFKAKKIIKSSKYDKLTFQNADIISIRVYPHQATTGTIEVVVEVEID